MNQGVVGTALFASGAATAVQRRVQGRNERAVAATPLKIAQPFMAGSKSPEPGKSRQGRQKTRSPISGLKQGHTFAQNTRCLRQELKEHIFCRPCRDSGAYLTTKPSHKWLGYFQRFSCSILLMLALLILAITPNAGAQSFTPPALPQIPYQTFNVENYGASGDGIVTNTESIQAAINAAGAAGGGMVHIPAGTFLCGPIHLASQVNLHMDAGALLRMLPLDKYPGGTQDPESFITGAHLHDVAISGSGAIDGQGAPWWPYARVQGAFRPRMIALQSCDRLLLEDVTLSNSPMFHIALGGKCSDVTVRRLTIRAPASEDPVTPSHNTDACDVTGHHVLIEDCDVSVGDDNFTCSGGTSDVLITNCTYGFGHGVSIGSHTAGGISNLTVVHCTFNGTDAGIRIKSDRDRGGFVHDLRYMDLQMTNVGCPILIYAAYMAPERQYRNLNGLTPDVAASYPAAPVGGRTPIYRNFTFSNITATAKPGNRAGLIWGLPEMPVSNVLLENVTITADKPLGIFNAQGVRLVNCKITTPQDINPMATANATVAGKP